MMLGEEPPPDPLGVAMPHSQVGGRVSVLAGGRAGGLAGECAQRLA